MSDVQLFSNDAVLEVLDPDSLTLHPVVFMFPELNQTDFDALVNSVRAHGQIDPVWITNENQIVDGRHRWKAQKKLGRQVQCRRLKNFKPELLTSIIDHCIAQNINRRYMNRDQRAVVAAGMKKKRVEAVAAQELGNLALDGGPSFPWSTFDEMLNTFNITKSYHDRARQLIDYGQPEMVEACANGTVGLSVGLNTARKTKPFTKGEVLKCLSARDPEGAINSHCFEKNTKQRERALARWNKERGYVPPSPAYDLLSNVYSDYYFSDEEKQLIENTDFTGVWEEEPEEVAEIFKTLVDCVRVKKILIAKLKAAKPTKLPPPD